MCQLDWQQGARIRHLFLGILAGCFQMRLTLESVDSVKQTVLATAERPCPILQALNRTRRRERRYHLFFPTSLLSWGPHLTFCPQNGIYTISSPSSQAFRLRPSYPTGFPGSPACREWGFSAFMTT